MSNAEVDYQKKYGHDFLNWVLFLSTDDDNKPVPMDAVAQAAHVTVEELQKMYAWMVNNNPQAALPDGLSNRSMFYLTTPLTRAGRRTNREFNKTFKRTA